MIDPLQLVRYVIRPVLHGIEAWSYDAEQLVLGTCCQESECGRWLVQFEEGPAHGIYQAERKSLMDNLIYLQNHFALKKKVERWLYNIPETWRIKEIHNEIIGNNFAATVMCRVHYLRFLEPIPDTLLGQAAYWKKYYNTTLGKGTMEDYIRSWNRFVGSNSLVWE